MSTPYLSEIRIMSFNYPPKGWAFCNGQLLPINQNQALFSLLGTTYGGDGRTTFGLPNLQGQTPIHMGNGYTLGQKGGEQNHTLAVAELPIHNHSLIGTQLGANTPAPGNALLATTDNLYAAPGNLTSLNPGSISNNGSSQPHLNMQPYLVPNFCIALQGIFPSQN
jgi:microcystin-dependent protein